MTKLRKITVTVPVRELKLAQDYTGKNITATVREGLKKLGQIRVQQEFRKLRGTVKFSMSAAELADKA